MRTALRPKYYMLFGYMDPWGHACRVQDRNSCGLATSDKKVAATIKITVL